MSFRPLHICHLSVLNPAQHSRIFHKEAITQAAAGHSVTIIAQDPAPHPYTENGIHIIPLGQFGRISWARWRAAAKLYQLACKTKADIFIIHTPELLDTALRLKKQFPLARFVYDMHEDYPLNIRTAAYYPWGLRHVLAAKVLQAERNFQAWGDAVVYAEACFEGHLKMKSGQAITVANKCLLPSQAPAPSSPKPGETPILLFTGTVAENWGILHALQIWLDLDHIQPTRLHIAGVCYDKALKDRILQTVAQSGAAERFQWVGNGGYVPHTAILEQIAHCSISLAPYQLRPNIIDRIPTRFYENMAFGKPVLYTANPAWDQLNARTPFGDAITFPISDAQIRQWIQRINLGWLTQIPPEAWQWEPEGRKLLALLQALA